MTELESGQGFRTLAGWAMTFEWRGIQLNPSSPRPSAEAPDMCDKGNLAFMRSVHVPITSDCDSPLLLTNAFFSFFPVCLPGSGMGPFSWCTRSN